MKQNLKKQTQKKKSQSRTPFFYVCPGCGQLLYHRAFAADRQFGSPLRPCPNCKTEYYDPRYREPALCRDPRLPVLPGTVWGGLLMGVAFLLGAVYMPQTLELTVFGLIFLATSTWFALDYRRTLPHRREELTRELEQSRQRLKDAAYCDKLRSYGVKIKR